MLNICLFLKTSELKYAYKLYAFKKVCTDFQSNSYFETF